eukprot:7128255-Ditylum_brightwellii.AAC.1
MHTSCMENSRTIACTDIVKDWDNTIVDCWQCMETTLYMGSYYLTDEGRNWLREKKEGRQESETFSIAYNKKTKESAMLCWTSTKMLGNKFVMGT